LDVFPAYTQQRTPQPRLVVLSSHVASIGVDRRQVKFDKPDSA
jgi:hypothetical protein